MLLTDIQQIPLKEKKFLLSEICLMYNKLRATGQFIVKQSTPINDRMKQTSRINEQTLSMFDTILGLLPSSEAAIIETEFIHGEKNK